MEDDRVWLIIRVVLPLRSYASITQDCFLLDLMYDDRCATDVPAH